jgi:Domain of unknown function (DUF4440)
MSQHSQSQIVELEERLRQAMLNSDVAELDALIAPELIFTNHFGHLFTKQQDLDIHQSGSLKFREITHSEQQIQLNEGFSVVSVKKHLCGSYQGAEFDDMIRFTRVWAISSMGSLQIVAGHSSVVEKEPHQQA